jgi:hypothetical protein
MFDNFCGKIYVLRAGSNYLRKQQHKSLNHGQDVESEKVGCKNPVQEIPEEYISLSRLFNDRLLVLNSVDALFSKKIILH